MQASIDGNSSLKHTSQSAKNTADFQSTYWLETAMVEQFASLLVSFDTHSIAFALHLSDQRKGSRIKTQERQCQQQQQ